jgi:peptidoglycan/xylan/chitin deacetylase (PgdA/CDA1 family)
MSQRLAIGIIDVDPGWEILLRQIAPWIERIDWNRVEPAHYAVVIVNRSVSRLEAGRLTEYLRAGGAVLDGADLAGHLGLATVGRSVATIFEGEPPFESVGVADVHARIHSLASARHLAGTIALEEHAGGWLAHVPFDIAGTLRSHAPARRRFHSPGGHHPDEVVARIAKRPYLAMIEAALRWLFARRGLPFVHLWYHPDGADSVFALRIDTDYGTPESLLRLRDLADRHRVPMTLFVHVGAHVDHLAVFDAMPGHELAVHGYRHRTFTGYEANWGNIAEATQMLRERGHDPRGFAAPTGRWNPRLDRALADLGFDYSSEFTLDYDGLPFHPWTGGGVSPVLQVPIHPISVGNLTRSGADEREIVAYFDAVLRRQRARRMPAFLYHHPLQEAWEAIDAVLANARASRAAPTTMGAYARWWRERARMYLRASLESGALAISLPNAAPSVVVRVVAPDGRECFLEREGSYDLEKLAWRALEPDAAPTPHDIASIRRPTPSMLRHSLEDAVSRFRQ